MNTKVLMILSSAFMGILGIALTFLPQELAGVLGLSGPGFEKVVLQLLGALYFSFSMVNWTAKANLIGGIYSRPVAIGNLVHFTVGALALIKNVAADTSAILIGLTFFYSVFAVAFGIVFFRHPVKKD